MDVKSKKSDVFFYQTQNGVEPVSGWLKELSKSDKKTIGEDIQTVQYGFVDPTHASITQITMIRSMRLLGKKLRIAFDRA